MQSILGVVYDSVLALRRQTFKYLRETSTYLGVPATGSFRKNEEELFISTKTPDLY